MRFLRPRDRHGSDPRAHFSLSWGSASIASIAVRPSPFVHVVKIKQHFPHVPRVQSESFVHFVRRYRWNVFWEQFVDDLSREREAGRGAEQIGQSYGRMRRDHKSQAPPATEPPERKAAPPPELFVAVDDDHRSGAETGHVSQAHREATLTVAELDQHGLPSCLFDAWDQRGDQRRLAASVRTDDLASPVVVLQALYQRDGTSSRREKKGDGPGPDVTCGERVLGGLRVTGLVHDAGTFTAGTAPSWNGSSPKTSLSRARNTRTRTHQRSLTITPW